MATTSEISLRYYITREHTYWQAILLSIAQKKALLFIYSFFNQNMKTPAWMDGAETGSVWGFLLREPILYLWPILTKRHKEQAIKHTQPNKRWLPGWVPIHHHVTDHFDGTQWRRWLFKYHANQHASRKKMAPTRDLEHRGDGKMRIISGLHFSKVTVEPTDLPYTPSEEMPSRINVTSPTMLIIPSIFTCISAYLSERRETVSWWRRSRWWRRRAGITQQPHTARAPIDLRSEHRETALMSGARATHGARFPLEPETSPEINRSDFFFSLLRTWPKPPSHERRTCRV